MTDKPAKKEPGEYCNARRFDGDRFLGYCELVSGWGTDKNEGRCSKHGGAGGAPTGEDNGAYKHGLYAEVGVDDEERELMERLEAIEDIEMFDMLVERELTRYLRAAGLVDEPAWTPDYNSDGIQVGESVDMNDGPLANRAALIASLLDDKSKAEHRLAKIDEGEKHRVETSMDDDDRSDLLDAIDTL
ncbi:hypothetical protein [Halococcus sp. PRR34]|uniref:hypothetical protein n=1 Tax=Halococcus sp. PRR34 TaxID=3020830 RepID=UPI0023629CC0|nr:hypothetical protein [Halococcus sp. PRR34]